MEAARIRDNEHRIGGEFRESRIQPSGPNSRAALGTARLAVLQQAPVRRIYVAGPITGRKNLNKPAFAEASEQLRLDGWSVFNPAAANLDDGRPLPQIMVYCLMRVCEADAIAMLPSWWRSGGARIEWLLARYLGLRIIYL